MSRRSRILGSAAVLTVGLTAGLSLAACTATTPAPPPDSPTPSPTPTTVDTAAEAASAVATFLKQNSYTISSVSGATVKFGDNGETYSTKVSCEGGATHGIGWNGVCAAPSEEAIAVVVVVSITGGPKVTTYALDEDAAAYCGDDTTPAWVKASLQKAAGEYCYLRAEDG